MLKKNAFSKVYELETNNNKHGSDENVYKTVKHLGAMIQETENFCFNQPAAFTGVSFLC